MSALLQVENLRVEIATRDRRLVAIDDVSFSIAEGEILGVVGESGAGKSVTGTAILGLLERPAYQAGGRITVCRPPHRRSGRGRRCARCADARSPPSSRIR